MSLFSNDIRVANTATPSFQQQANVGQFGWTGADQGHYNQLIQYVDECRKIWINLEEKIEYVNELLKEVQEIDEQVNTIRQVGNEVAEDARDVRAQTIYVTNTASDLRVLKAAFDTDYASFNNKYVDVFDKHAEAVEAATNAKESEIGAKSWHDKSYDLYLDLKEGQVYRGTWNPSTNSFPDNQGTNSVWDVILDSGLNEKVFGGFTWRNGDRLLYIVSEKKYDQLSTGSGVSSVNGQVGAVTISADSLSVVKRSGDKMLGPLQWGDTNKYVSGSGSNMYVAARSGIVYIEGKENPIARIGSNDYTIYHQGYKPTAADVGALPITGGSIKGSVAIENDHNITFKANTSGLTGDIVWMNDSVQTGRAWSSGDTRFSISSGDSTSTTGAGVITFDTTNNITIGGNTIYHQGFKPTAADVGALSSTGGVVTGHVSIQGSVLEVTSPNNPKAFNVMRFINNIPSIRYGGEGTGSAEGFQVCGGGDDVKFSVTNAGVFTSKAEGRVYGDKRKPTAADVGALSTSGGALNKGSTINDYGGGSLNLMGKQHGLVGGPISGYLTSNVFFDGTWKKQDNTMPSANLEVYQNNLEFRTSAAGESNPNTNKYKVYHQGFKPTAADVGALPITGGVVSGSISWDTDTYVNSVKNALYLASKAGRVYIEGKENPIARVGGVDYVFYHQGYKPTASDVGALPITGGTVTGSLTLSTSANRFNSNELTTVSKQILYAKDEATYFGNPNLSEVYLETRASGKVRANIGGTKYDIYHQGFKPTASDVGAAPAGFGLGSTSFVSRGSLNRLMDNGWQEYNSGVGDLDGPYAQGNVLHIGHKGNATNFAGWAAQLFMAVNGSMFTRANVNKGSFSSSQWHRIYTEKDKPTAFDIQVMDPRTKKEETLMEVIASLTARIEELEAKLK